MTVFTGWRKLRSPLPYTFDVQGAEQAREEAEVALFLEEVKAEKTEAVKQSLRDLHRNNHFADLIVDTVEDNSRRR